MPGITHLGPLTNMLPNISGIPEFPGDRCISLQPSIAHNSPFYQTLFPIFLEFQNSRMPGITHFGPLSNLLLNIPGISEFSGAGYITLRYTTTHISPLYRTLFPKFLELRDSPRLIMIYYSISKIPELPEIPWLSV